MLSPALFSVVITLICRISSALETPIIGILSEETYTVAKLFPDQHYDAYIAASYVKFLESSGAKIIPVWIGQNESYYEWVVNSTNGLLFPGGGTYFDEPNGYGEAATILYKFAKQVNNAGVHYPILGICLGMQVFPFAALGGKEINTRVDCDAKHIKLPLDFAPGYEDSRLFSSASKHIIHILKTENITYNNHHYCLTEDSLTKNGILDEWSILSHNVDSNGFKFISCMEHNTYPFYGVQYHPEKNAFEYTRNVPKSLEGVQASQYVGNFFVEECRRNNQTLKLVKEKDVIIHKYNPIYVGYIKDSYYEQLYMFKKEEFDDECSLVRNSAFDC